MKRKKVLINFVTLGRGGIDIPRLLKFRCLNELGFALYVFAGRFIKKIELVGKDVYSFNKTIPEFESLPETKGTKMWFMFFALATNIRALFFWREILRGGYGIIYSPAATLDLVLFPYLYKLFHRETKWVVVFDNIVPLSDPGNRFVRFLAWLFFKISFFFLRKADKIFVISEDLRDFVLEKGFSKEKIVLSTNGIENDLIEKARTDERYNFDALFMGRINETKGIYDMLKVLDIVRKKYPAFQLAIMGEGDKKTDKQFRRKIKEMNLENNVQFLGFRSGVEKFNVVKSAKCFWFLSVSESESFGMALLEAVCSGIPAFAYDLPSFARIYQNREVDFSPRGNYEMVARKVLRLFESGNFTNERGKLLLGKYSWEKVAEIEYKAIKDL